MPKPENKIFRECKVLYVQDDNAGLRIKVRFNPEDNHIKNDSDLPFCFPLLPKHLHVHPKEGEMVLVITSQTDLPERRRWFIGPVISQDYRLFYDNFYTAGVLLDTDNPFKPLPNPKLNPDNDGTLPYREDIAIEGRKNEEIILKPDEIWIRCGHKKEPSGKPENTLLFNEQDLAYIAMKYSKMRDKKGNEFSSSINIVADRINLLSHDSKTPFTLNDRKELITKDEMQKILENAHPMVYGDNLISFLKQLIEVIRTHTHPMAMDPPSLTTPQVNVLNTNLDEMLSQSIRIN